jgi:hypothetical protein
MAKYDVVKEYDWTSAPRGSGMRKKAPRVWVKSYKLKSNQIMQAIQGFVAIATEGGGSGDAKSFYDKMYGEATTAEDDFNFPFFNDTIRSFSNTFGDTFQNGIGGSGGIAGDLYEGAKGLIGAGAQAYNTGNWRESLNSVGDAASKGLRGDIKGAGNSLINAAKSSVGGSPGTYVESPMFYQFEKNDGPLEVSFVLSNTINQDSLEKNKNLIYRLTYINRPLRVNSIAVDPPRIYQVKVPGHRFIRWAYCSQFSTSMIGTRREINGVIVPEAYQINMSFQSLTLEHAGFMKEL